MEEYLDEACLIALCCLVLAAMGGDAFGVVGLLASVIVVCAQASGHAPLRTAAVIAFACGSCASSSLFAFLPVVAYAMLRARPWPIRLGWLVPICWHLLEAGPSMAFGIVCALAIIAGLLAIKDQRIAGERMMTRCALDALRKRNRMLADADEDMRALPADAGIARGAELLAGLTEREQAIARLVAEGMDNREISRRLFLSEGTVRNHISSILQKKSLANRTQIAVSYYDPRAISGGSIG